MLYQRYAEAKANDASDQFITLADETQHLPSRRSIQEQCVDDCNQTIQLQRFMKPTTRTSQSQSHTIKIDLKTCSNSRATSSSRRSASSRWPSDAERSCCQL